MTYATSADVEVSLGRSLTSEEQTQAAGLLERVELIIRRRIPTLAARIEDDTDLEAVVVMVEADAVARVLLNPSGVYQEGIDDYTYTRDRAISSGLLYVSEDEWELLLATPGVSIASEAFTIRPTGAAGYSTDVDDERTWVTPSEYLP